MSSESIVIKATEGVILFLRACHPCDKQYSIKYLFIFLI